MPKVSIVLPTFNGSKYISESLTSIINQTFNDWELIVVNDCSTDNTLDILNEFSSKDDRIKIINNPVNLKLPASLNEGFKHTSGVYYTWTSDDNRYKPNALQEMVAILDANSETGLVYCNMDMIDDYGNITNSSYKLLPPENLLNYNIIGACFLYRAEIAKKIGGYDTELFLVEDYEYWLRFFFNSNIYQSHFTLYEYRQHAESLTAKNKTKIVIRQRAKAKYKHIHEYINKISDLVTLHGLYYELLSSGIKLTETELLLFKTKDKDIERWYKSFVFYTNHKMLGSFLYKNLNFDLPTEISKYVDLTPSNYIKLKKIIKKIIKGILPYGLVRIIQKINYNLKSNK